MKFHYLPKEKLGIVPKTAGVYMLSSAKEILYIGKATNLRDRVKNHFAQPSYRDNLFVDQVKRIGWIETLSGIDALLLESQLIKSHQPKYNVMWKDDKNYFYVAITQEKLPRIFLTHQPSLPKPGLGHRPKPGLGARYIGPFVEGRAIKQVLRLLRKAFPYYTAKKHPRLACPYCHIGLCPGPKPDVKEYKKNIKNLAAVLKGRRVSVLKNLKKAMDLASKEQNFEKAATLRDQVFSLENIASHAKLQQAVFQESEIRMLSHKYFTIEREFQKFLNTKKRITRIEAYDISNIQGKQATGSMVTFLQGKPAKAWYRKFKIHPVIRQGAPSDDGAHPNDYAMIEQVISRRLKHTEWPYPDLMLIDGGKPQLSAALAALMPKPGLGRRPKPGLGRKLKILVVALAKRNNELFFPRRKDPVLLKNLPQVVSNLLLHIRDEAHRFAISYHHKLRRVDVLAGA